MAKIEAKKQDVQQIVGEDEVGANLPEELFIHYQQIGHALENYRSGKMPKVDKKFSFDFFRISFFSHLN